MKLEDAFERVVVINLAANRDRRRRLELNLRETNIADPAKIEWSRGICGDWTPSPPWWGAGNGAWGCLMSHVRVAQDAVHDKVSSLCVLEDDAVFHGSSSLILHSFMQELPSDWGQAYIGGQFLHREPETVTPWVMMPYNVNRTHAYALERSTIPKFLQHVLNAPDYFEMKAGKDGSPNLQHNCFHIDHQLGRAHERSEWKTYVPTWWIAGQNAGNSNISGRENPQLWWHWRARGYALPFFFLEKNATIERRRYANQFIHPGNNLLGDTLVDIGLDAELTDAELSDWLFMIAGEAIEMWKLPGFEIPDKYPDLALRAAALWEPGILEVDSHIMPSVAAYPANGFCGGLPNKVGCGHRHRRPEINCSSSV